MADRPYQQKVDEFLADYADKFIPSLVTGGMGEGVAKSQETTVAGMPMSKEQAQLERDKILAASIHPDTFNRVLDTMKGERAIPGHLPALGTPASQFSNSPEGQEAMGGRAVPIPHVSTGFNPPVPAGEFQNFLAANPADFASTHGAIDMTPNERGVYEPAIPPGGGGGGGWNWKGELANQGTWSVGPERFFVGGKEVPAGTPGAVSGDELARQRIASQGGSAIPLSAVGGSPVPVGRGGEVGGFEIPADLKSALAGIQKTLMTPSGPIYSRSGHQVFAGGYRPYQTAALEGLGGTLEKLIGTGANYQAKMAELQAEAPGRAALADYYGRMAGVHEAAIPSETFARYATGAHALAESQRPYAMPPGSAVYQGAKMLGFVPEKSEAIHPIIRDIINKSTMVDPTTGQTGGFDIRGARQKIGFMAPWLKAQGIEVPKEAYKMTKPEFMAEQKAWLARLPKKERAKYNQQYTDQLFNEYWGKD